MADPFLLLHLVDPFTFDVGGRVAPVSIRDQMIRGYMFVDHAINEKVINQSDRPLLVVGAGAAGVTAALRAARRGIPTVLVERANIPFIRQAGCRSRYVSATAFDWPNAHWEIGKYPWEGPPVPIVWRDDAANNLAAHWTWQFNILAQRYRRSLIVAYATELTRLAWNRTHVFGFFRNARTGRTWSGGFGAVVLCGGPGVERCAIPNYDFQGFEFWQDDPLTTSQLSLPMLRRPATDAHVLISGGGDGALQDLLRVTTDAPTAGDLYGEIVKAVGVLPPAWMTMLATIQDAEDQAQRAFIWSESSDHDHAVLHDLHEAHQSAINALFDPPLPGQTRDDGGGPDLWNCVYFALQRIMRTDIASVDFVYSCDHFSRCYSLNRFLTLLMQRYFADGRTAPRFVTFISQTRTHRVEGAHPHTCGQHTSIPHAKAWDCHGEWHTAGFHTADCFLSRSMPLIENESKAYNVVIIRHGADPAPAFPGVPPVPIARHMLPYRVPL